MDNNQHQIDAPFISADQSPPEITIKVLVIGVLLTVILVASNVYLGLKLGTTIAASIPAAVISMSILRLWKNYNVLENNIVQTMASAGEAVVAATAFVLPALLITGYWKHFDYWPIVCLTILGGALGVLISVPLRRVMLNHLKLKFPEGFAVGQVLKANAVGKSQIKHLGRGALFGGLISLFQTGFQICSDNLNLWFTYAKTTVFGFGIGFSPALFAAGYIVGPRTGMTLLLGFVFGWLIGIPFLSHYHGLPNVDGGSYAMAMDLWKHHLRFVGVGTMMLGGLWTLITLLKPICQGVFVSTRSLVATNSPNVYKPIRTEYDIPMPYVLWGSLICIVVAFFMIGYFLNQNMPGISNYAHYGMTSLGAIYILIGGFLVACIAAYNSGLIGMTNNPISGLCLICILIIASLILLLFKETVYIDPHHTSEAITLILFITTVVAIVGAISGENLQDLKTGQIVGATPWKQQVILFAGVVVAALIVGPVLELLFEAYGMGGVFPRPGMSTAQMLAAPQASLMATVTQGVFGNSLSWDDIKIGMIVAAICILIDLWLKFNTKTQRLSVLALGLAIYLPPEITLPVSMGGGLYWLAHRNLKVKFKQDKETISNQLETGSLLACGLVAGAALMGVVLAIPFVLAQNSDALKLVSDNFKPIADSLGVLSLVIISVWMYRTATKVTK